MFIVLIANAGVNRLERYLLRWRPKEETAGTETIEAY
jgi:hypothetical protein